MLLADGNTTYIGGSGYPPGVKPIGPKSAAERAEGPAFLKKETRPESKHGSEVSNDAGFVGRFGDLRTSPAIRWLDEQGLLAQAARKDPPKLAPEQKKQLLNALWNREGSTWKRARDCCSGTRRRRTSRSTCGSGRLACTSRTRCRPAARIPSGSSCGRFAAMT